MISNLNTKLGNAGQALGSRRMPVSCENIRYYFSQDEWASIFTREQSMQIKIDAVVHRVVKLGYWNPTEKSYAVMASIVLWYNGAMLGDDVLSVVRDIKARMRSMTAKMPLMQTRPDTALPANPDDFKVAYPLIFDATFGPVVPAAPPGDVSSWMALLASVPCRSTRAGCQAKSAVLRPRAQNALHVLGSALQHQQLHGLHRAGDIPITYLTGHQSPLNGRSPSSESLGSPQPLLALPAPPTTAQPSVARLALPAPEHAVTPSVAPLAVPAPNASLSDPAVRSEHIEVADSVAGMVEEMQKLLKKNASTGEDYEADGDEAKGDDAKGDDAKGDVGTNRRQAYKRPAAAAFKRPAAVAFPLGCSKCRFSVNGCRQCRSSSFSGCRAR